MTTRCLNCFLILLVLSFQPNWLVIAQMDAIEKVAFDRHEVTIIFEGPACGLETVVLRETLRENTASIQIPDNVQCPGKAALTGSIQMRFPSESPPATMAPGVDRLSRELKFEKPMGIELQSAGLWQITPDNQSESRWQNASSLRVWVSVGEREGFWIPRRLVKDEELSDNQRSSDSIAIAHREEGLLDKLGRFRIPSRPTELETFETSVKSVFATEVVGRDNGVIASFRIEVQTFYVFTTGENRKNLVIPTSVIPCNETLRPGSRQTLEFNADYSLQSHERALLEMRIWDDVADDFIATSEPAELTFADSPGRVRLTIPDFLVPDRPISEELSSREPVLSINLFMIDPESGELLEFAEDSIFRLKDLHKIAEYHIGEPQDTLWVQILNRRAMYTEFTPGGSYEFEAWVRFKLQSEPMATLVFQAVSQDGTVLAAAESVALESCTIGKTMMAVPEFTVGEDIESFSVIVALLNEDGTAIKTLEVGKFNKPSPAEQVTLISFKGDVEVRRSGESVEPQIGMVLMKGDDISTWPDAEARVKFPDGTILTIKELSQMNIGSLLSHGSGLVADIVIKIGELSAQVNPDKDVSTDFSFRAPIATASIRGTSLDFSYVEEPEPKAVIEVSEGEVRVVPNDVSLLPVIVKESQQAEITADTIAGNGETVALPTLDGFVVSRFAVVEKAIGLDIDAQDRLFVLGEHSGILTRIDRDGSSVQVAELGEGVNRWMGPLVGPTGVLYAGDVLESQMLRIQSDGMIEIMGNEVLNPAGLAVDPEGQLYVTSTDNAGSIVKLSQDVPMEVFASLGLVAPGPLALSGNNLFVGDRARLQIRRFSTSGSGPGVLLGD